MSHSYGTSNRVDQRPIYQFSRGSNEDPDQLKQLLKVHVLNTIMYLEKHLHTIANVLPLIIKRSNVGPVKELPLSVW